SDVPAVPSRRCAPWKFWGTTLWSLAIVLAGTITSVVSTIAVLTWLDPPDLDIQALMDFLYARTSALIVIVCAAAVACFAVLALAVRLSGLGMKDYLGLIWPRHR